MRRTAGPARQVARRLRVVLETGDLGVAPQVGFEPTTLRFYKKECQEKYSPLELKPGESSRHSAPLRARCRRGVCRAAGLVSPGSECNGIPVVIPISFSEPVVFCEPVSWPTNCNGCWFCFLLPGRALCVFNKGPTGQRTFGRFSKRHQAKRMGCMATIVLSETLGL